MRDKTTRRIYAKPTVTTASSNFPPKYVDATRRHTYSEHAQNGNHNTNSLASNNSSNTEKTVTIPVSLSRF